MARSKKEIDKELMYKKLMPTANSASDNEQPENDAAMPADEPAAQAPPAPQAATPDVPVQPAAPVLAAPAAPAPTVPSASPSDLSAAAAALVSGHAQEPEGELVNVMELLVNSRIDAAMEKFRCCTCDKCKKDVTAITLNKLVPCYILSSDDGKRVEAEAKYAGQVATSLVQAILTVKARPTHD